MPSRKLTVNLAPADRRKEGSAFDLPISLGLLAFLEVVPAERLQDYLFIGELAMDGRLKPVRGILPAALLAQRKGYRAIVIPKENEKEAALVGSLDIYGLENLVQVVRCS
jgi:magnesium chelatase family protein